MSGRVGRVKFGRDEEGKTSWPIDCFIGWDRGVGCGNFLIEGFCKEPRTAKLLGHLNAPNLEIVDC